MQLLLIMYWPVNKHYLPDVANISNSQYLLNTDKLLSIYGQVSWILATANWEMNDQYLKLRTQYNTKVGSKVA